MIPLYPPLPKGDFMIPLFGKEGLGEIFIVPCDRVPSQAFHRKTPRPGGRDPRNQPV